jgi:hypothetical protein
LPFRQLPVKWTGAGSRTRPQYPKRKGKES